MLTTYNRLHRLQHVFVHAIHVSTKLNGPAEELVTSAKSQGRAFIWSAQNYVKTKKPVKKICLRIMYICTALTCI